MTPTTPNVSQLPAGTYLPTSPNSHTPLGVGDVGEIPSRETQLAQHRAAWQTIMTLIPGSVFISHETHQQTSETLPQPKPQPVPEPDQETLL